MSVPLYFILIWSAWVHLLFPPPLGLGSFGMRRCHSGRGRTSFCAQAPLACLQTAVVSHSYCSQDRCVARGPWPRHMPGCSQPLAGVDWAFPPPSWDWDAGGLRLPYPEGGGRAWHQRPGGNYPCAEEQAHCLGEVSSCIWSRHAGCETGQPVACQRYQRAWRALAGVHYGHLVQGLPQPLQHWGRCRAGTQRHFEVACIQGIQEADHDGDWSQEDQVSPWTGWPPPPGKCGTSWGHQVGVWQGLPGGHHLCCPVLLVLRTLAYAWAWARNFRAKDPDGEERLFISISEATHYADEALRSCMEFGGGSLLWLNRNDLLTRGKMASGIRRGWTAGKALKDVLQQTHLEWRAPSMQLTPDTNKF